MMAACIDADLKSEANTSLQITDFIKKQKKCVCMHRCGPTLHGFLRNSRHTPTSISEDSLSRWKVGMSCLEKFMDPLAL